MDTVTEFYGLHNDNISVFVTDNGSNIVKAYREDFEVVRFIVSEEAAAALEAEEGESEAVGLEADPNIEESDYEADEDEEPAPQDVTLDVFEEFDSLEQQFDVVFTKRISCFDHNLELVLRKSVENCKQWSSVLCRARKTLRKAKSSVAAKAALKQKCGKSFILPGVTRWGANYLMASRITEIWRSVNEVWYLKGWPIFLERDIRFLEQFCKVVKPFYDDLMGMQADSYVTSSRVYVRIKELLKHCDKFKGDQGGISELAADIKLQLLKRFGHFVDNRSPRFNAHFVVASLVDPATAFMVDMDLSYLNGLMSELLNIRDEGRDVSDTESILEATENETFEEMMLRKRKLPGPSSQNVANSECGRYLQSVMCDDVHAMREVDAIPYWLNEGKAKFPTLASTALDYLAIPATSAPVERCFSAAGLAMDGKKANTKAPLLNNKLLIHLNKHLL